MVTGNNIREDNIQRLQAVAAEKNILLSDGVIGNIAEKYGDTPMRIRDVYREVENAIEADKDYEIPDDRE